MAEVRRYYWLKLKRDFFKRHDIRVVESMPNGKDYVLFYLKLMLEAVDHEGNLRFSDTIPYNVDMLAAVTNTNVDVVKSAMNVFTQLQMIEILDDQTIFMNEVEKLIGSETNYAKKMRESRERKKIAEGNIVTPMLPERYPEKEIEIEKDIDIEIDKEKEKEKKRETTLTLFNRLSSDYLFDMDSHSELRSKMEEWCRYKMERKEPYKEQGMKSLLRKVENNALTYGDQAVCELIEECMANNWKGIIFDRLEKQPAKPSKPVKQSYQPQYGQPSQADTERMQRILASMKEEPKTAGNDEVVRQRAEELKRKLG